MAPPSPFAAAPSDRVDTGSLARGRERMGTDSQAPLKAAASRQEVYLSLGLPWPPTRKLRLAEGIFQVSPSQPVTPGQGNSCMFHAILDQLNNQSGVAASHSQLRSKLVQAAYNSVKSGKLSWPEGERVEEWRAAMSQEGTMGDQVILQTAANLFKRDIVIIPVFWDASHLAGLGVTLVSPSTSSPSLPPLSLQYYSESRFLTPHYQSIRPLPGHNHILTSIEKKPGHETEEDFILQLNSLPDPPVTPVRQPDSSSFTLPLNSPHPATSPSSVCSMSISSSRSSSRSSSSSASSFVTSPPLSPSSPRIGDRFMSLLGKEVRGLGKQTRI